MAARLLPRDGRRANIDADPHVLVPRVLVDAIALVDTSSGGGLLGIDLMETSDGYTVHEVNSTCEWKGLDQAIPEVDVPARITDWLEMRAEQVPS